MDREPAHDDSVARALILLLSGVCSSAVRPRHLLGALVAGVLTVAAAVSVTPVGQQWVDDVSPSVSRTTSDLIDNVRGILP